MLTHSGAMSQRGVCGYGWKKATRWQVAFWGSGLSNSMTNKFSDQGCSRHGQRAPEGHP